MAMPGSSGRAWPLPAVGLTLLGTLVALLAVASGAVALPDFQVTISAAVDAPDNSQVAINITLTNAGDTGAPNTSVVLAIDGNPTDPPLEFAPLAVGASATLSTSFALSCGYHNITGSPDPDNVVPETSEANNNASATAKVLPLADFSTALVGVLGAYNLSADAAPSHGCAPLTYAWEAIPGGDFSGPAVSFAVMSGNVTVTLTIASQADATLAARATHIVSVPNRKPSIEASLVTPEVLTGTPVLVTLAASDSDGTVAQYFADFGDGTNSTVLADIIAHRFAQPGAYTVEIRATDNLGATNETSFEVTVLNRVPAARADPPYWYGEVGEEAVLNGSSSADPEGGALTYAWQFGDGETGSGAVAHHTYAAPGAYNAVLTVTDEHGATSAVTVTVQVLTPPGNSPGTSLLTVGFLLFLVVFVVVYVVKVRSRPPESPPQGPGRDEKKAIDSDAKNTK